MTLFIDLSHEESDYEHSKKNILHKGWLAHEINETDWLVKLSANEEKEIKNMIDDMVKIPLPFLLREVNDFEIPSLRKIYKKIKCICDNGIGFAVIDKLPLDDFDEELIKSVYWVLGQLIGKNVAQKWDGTMLYDVKDSGNKYGYGVRGSATNVELVFHTDNAFGIKPPEYVGLLCKYPAHSGGISRFCSLYTVHERLKNKFPNELKRLYKPMLFDRQAEHAKGEPKTTLAPFFSFHNGRLKCRANTSLIKNGYEIARKNMDSDLIKAIKAIEEITSSKDLWIEAPLKRGQIQYLNNFELGHFRSKFIDRKNSKVKRHLFRLWHRSNGKISYDGI